MSKLISEEGQVIDKELNELGLETQARFNKLLDSKTEWTIGDKIVAAYHLQGYISTEIMRRIVGQLIKKQQAAGTPAPSLRLTKDGQ